MWGKVIRYYLHPPFYRITPTHVGKRALGALFYLLPKDHPHPCGEKSPAVADCERLQGSPPPMWGKVYKIYYLLFKGRITPTHVGKRKICCRVVVKDGDHPHPCGEKIAVAVLCANAIGSPPPMWGKGVGRGYAEIRDRITPTHVGKSNAYLSPPATRRDHPHPCGEKSVFLRVPKV